MIAHWECRACDVRGSDPEGLDDVDVRCWWCGGPVTVTARTAAWWCHGPATVTVTMAPGSGQTFYFSLVQ